ncbi:alpha/beta hydrolase family protein [Chitinophaga sp. 212800010-3]|uniref:alpha/beta hydrolase n=1 Tax=unclassified Chitinophaga TaxID=2619133 RepID=UPI002DE34823|nr:Endo-1,4-beta-xylanase Z [Chitinophaga sp. 212800010-3]
MKLLARLLFLLCLAQVAKAADVDTVSIYSDKMHRSYKCVVITPASCKTATTRFPSVYLLQGYSGNYANWIQRVPWLRNVADSFQLILVCPDPDYSSWYFDSPIDSSMRFETYISKEIPAWIDQHYPTLAEPRFRAVTGLSMGGHGALFLGIRHQDVFGAAGSMSGGVDIRPFPKNWDIAKRLGEAGKDGVNWNDYTVINQTNKLKPGGSMPLIIDCGIKDFFIDVNRNLHKKLLEEGIDHDYIERPGQHDWKYWSNSIKYQLLFFHEVFMRNGQLIKN